MITINVHLDEGTEVSCATLGESGRHFASLRIGPSLSLLTTYGGQDQLRKIRDCIDAYLKPVVACDKCGEPCTDGYEKREYGRDPETGACDEETLCSKCSEETV